MDATPLPPELERYADQAVAAGRFRDRADILAGGLRLLQQCDTEVDAFAASLEEARAESNRDSWLAAHDVHAEMAALINEARRAKG
jgi:Arc/MetJ-type ribon-helix-helix transcriptional regulator